MYHNFWLHIASKEVQTAGMRLRYVSRPPVWISPSQLVAVGDILEVGATTIEVRDSRVTRAVWRRS